MLDHSQNVNMLIFFRNFLVWETDQWTRHLILKRIVEYIFVRHLSPMSKDHIMHAVDQIDFSLLHGSGGILWHVSFFSLKQETSFSLIDEKIAMTCIYSMDQMIEINLFLHKMLFMYLIFSIIYHHFLSIINSFRIKYDCFYPIFMNFLNAFLCVYKMLSASSPQQLVLSQTKMLF